MALTPFRDINDGEDAIGYTLHRLQLAHRHGLSRFMQRLGMTGAHESIINIPEFLPKIAELLQIDDARLRSAWFIPEERKTHAWLRGFGQRLRSSTVVWPRVRLCPACLAEKGFIPQLWQLTAYTDCPHHSTQLICACPKCRRSLTWTRRVLTRCACGFDLRQAVSAPSDPNVLALVADIERRAGGQAPTLFTEFAQVRDLQDFLDLCLIVGRWETGAPTIGKMTSCETDLTKMRELLAAAGAILASNWPQSFHDLLDRRMVPPPATGRVQLKKMFPGIYLKLYRIDQLAPLREEFERYIALRHANLVSRLGACTTGLRRWKAQIGLVLLSEVAKRLHVDPKRLQDAARHFGVPILRGPRNVQRLTSENARHLESLVLENGVVWLGRSWRRGSQDRRRTTYGMDVAEYLTRRPFPDPDAFRNLPDDAYVSVALLADRWAISKGTIRAMIDANYFARFHSGADDMRRIPMLACRAVEQAVARIARPWPQAGKPGLISLVDALCHRLRTQGVSLADVLTELIDGMLGPCFLKPTGIGLARLYVPTEHVTACISRLRNERSVKEREQRADW